MQRLELQNRRELSCPAQFLGNNVSGDLGGERQRESHKSEDSNKGGRPVNIWRGVRQGQPRLWHGERDAAILPCNMGSATTETVAILGASPKPDRYAYKAFEMLREYGHRPIPINPAFSDILGAKCYPKISDAPGPIDTVTLYLGAARSNPLIDEIVATKPRRIIMNAGAENHTLAENAEEAGIE